MDAVAIAGAGAEVAGAVAEAEPTSPIGKTPKLRVVEPPSVDSQSSDDDVDCEIDDEDEDDESEDDEDSLSK